MERTIRSLVIIGAKYISKMSDKELEDYDLWIRDYIKQLEKRGRKFTKKERDLIYRLVAGIIKKYGNYDERYHLYLIGRALEK